MEQGLRERGRLVPVRAEPADEFERVLGEALEDFVNQGERLLRLLQCGWGHVQARRGRRRGFGDSVHGFLPEEVGGPAGALGGVGQLVNAGHFSAQRVCDGADFTKLLRGYGGHNG